MCSFFQPVLYKHLSCHVNFVLQSHPNLGEVNMLGDFHLFGGRYFDYLFYIDFEASMADPRAQFALGHLQVSLFTFHDIFSS